MSGGFCPGGFVRGVCPGGFCSDTDFPYKNFKAGPESLGVPSTEGCNLGFFTDLPPDSLKKIEVKITAGLTSFTDSRTCR